MTVVGTTHGGRVRHFFRKDVYFFSKPEDAFSSMAVVCALLFTIPFGIMGNFSVYFFDSLRVLDSCESDSYIAGSSITHAYVASQITSNFCCAIYSSMIGIVFSTIFFLFKPGSKVEVDSWMEFSGKLLLVSHFTVTATAVISIMNLAVDLLQFYSLPYDLCDYDLSIFYIPGVVILVVSTFFAPV